MLRRPLTRIELKMDDRVELEGAIVERLREAAVDADGAAADSATSSAGGAIDPKKTPTKTEQIKARIGYNPAPLATDGDALR